MSPQTALAELQRRLSEVADLGHASALLDWDQNTKMPPGGAAGRADQLATLERLGHERFTDSRVGELLDSLRDLELGLDPDGDEACLIRVARRRYDKQRRVPGELAAEIARAGSLGQQAWAAAREASDFARFAPALERIVELQREYARCVMTDDVADPYDVLLDDFEQDARTADVTAVFARIADVVQPLVTAIVATGRDPAAALPASLPVAGQRAFAEATLRELGFEDEHWRMDPTVHPFATGIGSGDIRLTTRFEAGDAPLFGVFAAIHEFGHGLYQRQVDPALEHTILWDQTSMGLHESQSRLWENLVGRSLPFWRHAYPRLQEALPELGGLELGAFHAAINAVAPTLVRTAADEVTYCLHIVLRFELERELLFGSLSVADLPAAWNERMRDLLGLDVPDDRHGVLQDVHWSAGAFGYFPTYLLGTAMGAQIWDRAAADLGDVDALLERGDVAPLRNWLREHLHRHGAKFAPAEMLHRVTGAPLDPEPFLTYLTTKYRALYELDG